ncbi:MAG: tetratricopeptide repeat protein [Myxococcota bacterium]
MRYLLVGALFLSACASTAKGPGTRVDDPVAEARSLFTAEAQRLKAELDAGTVDWSRVEKSMARVVRLHDQIPEAWYDLGLARAERADLDGAITAYERAIGLRPDMHPAYENLASLYVAKDQPSRAVRLLERIVELQPAAATARVSLAHRRLEAGRLDEVEGLCREALAYEPELDEAYCLLAAASRSRTDWDRVRLLAGQGFKLDPNAACLHEALGDAFRAEGKGAEAMAAYERALKSDPERHTARGRAATLAVALDDHPRARAHLETLVEAQPEMASAWVALGRTRRAVGEPESAVQAFEQALRVEPDNGEAHYGLAWVALRDLADFDTAETHLRKALQSSELVAKRAEPLLEEARTLRRYAEQAAQVQPEPAPEASEPTGPPARVEPEPEPEPAPTPPAEAVSAPKPAPKPAPGRKPRRRPKPKVEPPKEEPLDLPTDDDFE